MSSVLICSTPAHGHVTPLVAVAAELIQQGHRVRFLTGSRFRERVEGVGAEFLPLPTEADFDDRTVDADHPGRAGLTGAAAMRFDVREIFLRPAASQHRTLTDIIAAGQVDVILVEPLFLGVIPLLLQPRASRPAIATMGILPLSLASRDTAPFGLGLPPRHGWSGRLRNAALALLAERVIFASTQRLASRMVQQIAGQPLPVFVMNWPAMADAIIQLSVPGFEYPRSDLPPSVHFVGPVSETAAATGPRSAADLPSWWDELHTDRPVVLVTQGTVANSDYSGLIGPTIAGLADQDALVVVTTGGPDTDTLPQPLPANVRAARFLPYDLLLPLVDVMVTNGGYGGVHFALRHGVPLVVAGATEDKVEVSARIGWSGVGVNLATARPSPAQIAAAVDRVLTEPRFAAASARLGQEIGQAPGARGVSRVIDDLLSARADRHGVS